MKYLSASASMLFLLLLLFFTACSDGSPQADMNDAQEDLEEMIPENDNAVDQQLADYNWLKAYLPAQVGEQQAATAKGELTNMMGYEISRAEAKYGERTTISIADISLAGTELGKLGAWMTADLAKVDGESIERTTILNDTYRALEKYDADTETATVSVLVDNRYLITGISDREYKVDELKTAILSMPLATLAGESEE